MSTQPDVYDLQVYKESTLYLQFQLNMVDDDGNGTGPYNLTGLVFEVTLRDILGTDRIWLSTDPADDDGSYIAVIGDPVLGRIDLNISAETLSDIRKLKGDWSMRRRYSATHAELFLLGTVVVNPISAGGNI